MYRQRTIGFVVALLASLCGPGTAAADSGFLYQTDRPAPLANGRTYDLVGVRTPSGCSYSYPALHVQRDQTRWEVRAVGLDLAGCRMQIEEGVPNESDLVIPAPKLEEKVQPSQAVISPLLATSSVASGWTSAWFEDGAGIHVTQDTTYISWSYSGSCVSGGSASGQWTWDSLFTLVSHGGTNSYSGCSYFLGDTWSTMKTISLPCPWTTVWTYYYHVRSYGWKDGSFGANYDSNWAQNNCVFPLWPHWSYAKTG
jgi:hypothetical protein